MPSQKSKNLNQQDDVLNEVTAQLAKYYSLGTSESLLDMVLAADPVVVASTKLHNVVRKALLDTLKGAYTTVDLVKSLKIKMLDLPAAEAATAEADLKKILVIIGGPDVGDQVTVTVNDMLVLNSQSIINNGYPTKNTPGLSAIICRPIGISPSMKNVAALSLFMNTIPTIEFSRAVPYIELNLLTGRPMVSIDGRLNAPSAMKFLLGSANVAGEGFGLKTANNSLATAMPLQDASEGYTQSGMEMFLGPQLMAPVHDGRFQEGGSPTLRATPILDPFRPVIALNSVDIDVAASQGFMSFKTAKVELILYDRSRLAEVADLVKPDLYSKTEFILEYGWHHPDDIDKLVTNPWGALLNAMRVREKYGIVNSSFAFQDDSTVKITLQLAMKGSTETRTLKIGDTEEIQGNIQRINELQERIGELRSAMQSKLQPGVAAGKSVMASQILDDAQSTNGNLDIPKKQLDKIKQIRDRVRANGTSKDAQELADALTELYISGDDGEPSAVTRFRTSVASAIAKKFRALNGLSPKQLIGEVDAGSELLVIDGSSDEYIMSSDSALDPFIDLKLLTRQELKATKTSRYVSLGKVMLVFLGEPMAVSRKFDDIQFIFYPFNSSAGASRNKSVASFLIDREKLSDEFKSYTIGRRGDNMSIGEFMNFLTQTFLDNVADINYGMSTIYTQSKPDKDGSVRIAPNSSKYRDKKHRDASAATDAEAKMRTVGVASGMFKIPQVDIHIECIPARSPDGFTGPSNFDEEKTILRFHVFDKAATAYETQSQLIAATRDDALNTIGYMSDSANKDDDAQAAAALGILRAAEKTGLIKGHTSPNVQHQGKNEFIYTHYEMIGGPEAVKQFVMSTAPCIIYGASNTAVESIGLTSIQDPALATVNMLRNDRAGAATPEGHGKGGLPLKTIPAELSVSTMGCPLLSFMQQFFVDAQTGTDLDNIYAITGLNHSISAQGFKSSFKCTPQQAYGKLESALNKVEQAITELETLTNPG